VSTHTEQQPIDEAALRFQLGVQSSRLLVQSLMAAVAALGWATGLLRFDLLRGATAYLTGVVTTFLFAALYRRAFRRRAPAPPPALWMAADTLLISWTVWIIEDQYPLWLIWYLISATSAAFVGGRRAAHAVIVASCAAYLGVLVGLGRIRGLDAELALAAGRLALLFGGTYFMIRGIADLRQRKLQVAAPHAEKSAQLDELRRLAGELERRRGELTEAHRRTQEADRAKSQFLANMSHELRTPLNSIIGFSEILSERLAGRIEPRFERFLHNVLGSGRHLLGLINDILDLSKIEAGRMELAFERISLGELVRGVESVMHSIASQRRVAIALEIDADLPVVVADGPRVKQILYNLLSNAVKFAPADSTVRVRALRTPAGRDPVGAPSVTLEVEDSGPGIRSEDQELIFEEFRQVDGQTTRNMGGTGLGLALVKRFVEMHGGRVEVDSEPGRGSLFRVVLPLDPAAGERRDAGDPVSFGFRVEAARTALERADAPLVVVAEDDADFFAAFAAELEAAGYRVERAQRGDEALEKIRELAPAAVVLDLVLPVRDGWEVLKELKAHAATDEIPVLIVSVVPDRDLGLALGADDYFLKPLDRARFLDRLRELVPPDGRRRPRVLVVDDDPVIHDLLTLELEEAGFEVRSAYDGRTGIEDAVAEPPALIVLDLVMAEIDGFRVALELQEREETRHVPIVVFTSKELDVAERRALAERAAAVLSKAPEDRRRLPAVLRELESRRRGRGPDAASMGGRG
jgi:signal transduction histidine kinase/DNA-binding response OmpR family regulator